MRKLLVIAITVVCLALQLGSDVLAQEAVEPILEPGTMTPSVLWQARYDGPMSYIDRVTEMALHPDGETIYVTGESYGELYSLDYITLAYDANTGVNKWSSRYDPPWRRNDRATHVIVSPDGNMVYVTGTSIGSGADGGVGMGLGDADWDFVTLAYDPQTGDQIWEQRYHGHQRGGGWTNSMTIAPNSRTVLINGRSNCMDNPETVEPEPGNATIAYDALTGEELWVACFDACLSYGDFGTQLAVSADSSTAILTGTRRNYNTGYDFATVALDIRTGERLWVRHYDNGLHDPDAFFQEPLYPGADPTLDSPRAIAVDPIGSVVYVTGVSRGHYGFVDYVTVAYEISNGEQRGVARFDGSLTGHDFANAIAVSPDGARVYVTGESQTANLGTEAVTIAYDQQLREELWVVHHNTSDAEILAPAGQNEIVGASKTADSSLRAPDGRNDIARLIGVSDDGQTVIVGGDSWGAHSLDWMFVAYDADTGQRQWSGLYDGVLAHADFYRGLAVNGDASRVFFTGHTCSCGVSGLDMVSMAIRLDIEVIVDIQPGSVTNSINPRSLGVIPVAILGTEEFDVSSVDVSTLAFGPDAAGIAHGNGHLQDLNYDSFMDLVLHFRTQDTGIACGDESASLKGDTLDGQPFEGSDSIWTVGCRARPRPAIWTDGREGRPDRVRRDGPVQFHRR